MKRLMTGVVAAAMLVPALTACGGDDAQEFCEAGEELDSAAFDVSDPDAAKDLLQDLADQAPDDIKGDFDTMVEQLELASSDPASIDTTAVTEASANIEEWTTENCN
ncbi:hypothetical protein [Ornithinimicrobium faecis]|uniref:Uncharacterized protein n=1 Tax=Ornithinimicrobium faecis TaxID=2934158 RepID=A0ABY4YPB4_9MICO|nr:MULTISPECIES: hypothetical protein [unclassified Ornithinimicrobium]USQ78454.1 hypothetical protein NF556_12480 [Ornithinimicrobium sp. HY1793]